MDIQKLIGLRVTHVTWGPGSITKADDKYVWVEFDEGSLKKYQYPKAFAAFLTIDDPLLQKEILDEEKNSLRRLKLYLLQNKYLTRENFPGVAEALELFKILGEIFSKRNHLMTVSLNLGIHSLRMRKRSTHASDSNTSNIRKPIKILAADMPSGFRVLQERPWGNMFLPTASQDG